MSPTSLHSPSPCPQSLQSVGGQLLLKGNGVLMDLSPLRQLSSVGTYYFINNGNTQVGGVFFCPWRC